jgi:small subunit ribosomal protein S18
MAQPTKKRIRKSKEPCYFCINGKTPDYKEVETLSKYVSGKGRIVSRWTTGICEKHQRRLATAIKRARHLAMMRFV